MTEQKEISNFTIRIETNLKKQFTRIAKQNDSDASKEVRKFIKKYIIENTKDKKC